MYGIVNFTKIETSKGANTAFAPPENFEGDYIQFMRDRFKKDPGVRQHVFIAARRIANNDLEIEFLGDYANEAKSVCWKIASSFS